MKVPLLTAFGLTLGIVIILLAFYFFDKRVLESQPHHWYIIVQRARAAGRGVVVTKFRWPKSFYSHESCAARVSDVQQYTGEPYVGCEELRDADAQLITAVNAP